MKRIFIFTLLSLIISNLSNSQIKVDIQLTNRHVDAQGLFCFDVMAVIQSGQTWKVGSSNIRIDFYTVPTGHLTVHPDSLQAANALTCLNSGNYSPMTTTAINNRTAMSVNITHSPSAPCCTLTASGNPYRLCTLRWNRTDTTGCSHDTIRTSSVVFDSLTVLVYGTTWGSISPTGQDTCALLTPVNTFNSSIPTVFKLYNNYPNPFNPKTIIRYDVPKTSFVKLTIYDVIGREVATIVNEKKEPGRYDAEWDATNYASGVYFCKMETDIFTDIKKMVLLK